MSESEQQWRVSQVLTRYYRVFISKKHPPMWKGKNNSRVELEGLGQKVNSEVGQSSNRAGQKVS